MADSQFPLKLLLVPLILVVAVLGAQEKKERQCAQCVSGNFLARRWVMQHSPSGQSMGWVDQWPGTNCATGVIRVIKCYHSCITITMQTRASNGELVHDGMMKDCDDDLIHSSPDLPGEGLEFLKFYGDASYTATRLNYTITYDFTLEGFKSPETVVQELAAFKLPDNTIKVSWSTIIVVSCGISFVAFICICWCVDSYLLHKPETEPFESVALETRVRRSVDRSRRTLMRTERIEPTDPGNALEDAEGVVQV